MFERKSCVSWFDTGPRQELASLPPGCKSVLSDLMRSLSSATSFCSAATCFPTLSDPLSPPSSSSDSAPSGRKVGMIDTHHHKLSLRRSAHTTKQPAPSSPTFDVILPGAPDRRLFDLVNLVRIHPQDVQVLGVELRELLLDKPGEVVVTEWGEGRLSGRETARRGCAWERHRAHSLE